MKLLIFAVSLMMLSCACSTRGDGVKIPVFKISYKDSTDKYFYLRSRYGVVFNGAQKLIVVYGVEAESVATNNLIAFKDIISKIPIGSDVDFPETCTCPTWFGLDPDFVENAHALVKNSGLQVIPNDDERHLIVCYCESLGFEIVYNRIVN